VFSSEGAEPGTFMIFFPSLIYFNNTYLLYYQMLNGDVPQEVEPYVLEFEVTPRLKERLVRWEEESLEDDLFSPLTSPESTPGSSPASTPKMKATALPVEKVDPLQAEPLPSTAQERLKRCRLVQGRNNRAKWQ